MPDGTQIAELRSAALRHAVREIAKFFEEIVMRNVELNLPQLAMIAGTRGLLGAGLGLLIADRIPKERRQAVGWTLVAVGALTTIPLAMQVLQKKGLKGHNGRAEALPQREAMSAAL